MQVSTSKISEILKSSRERAGLGLRELGRRAGVSRTLLCNLEAGKAKLGPVTLVKLSNALLLSEEEHSQLVEAAKLTSSRMQDSVQVTKVETFNPVPTSEWLGKTLVEGFGHHVGVGPGEIDKAYGGLPRYVVILRLKDSRWLGFAFANDAVLLAMTESDNPLQLANPTTADFEKEGGIVLRLSGREKKPAKKGDGFTFVTGQFSEQFGNESREVRSESGELWRKVWGELEEQLSERALSEEAEPSLEGKMSLERAKSLVMTALKATEPQLLCIFEGRHGSRAPKR